jgi:hypothetical protein
MRGPRYELTRFLHDDLFGLRARFSTRIGAPLRLLDIDHEGIVFRLDVASGHDRRDLVDLVLRALVLRYGDAIRPAELQVGFNPPAAGCPGHRPVWIHGKALVPYASRIPEASTFSLDPRLERVFDGPLTSEQDATIRRLWSAGEADGWRDPIGRGNGQWWDDRAFGIEDRGFEFLEQVHAARVEQVERERPRGLRRLLGVRGR